jgi:hypothetical protein
MGRQLPSKMPHLGGLRSRLSANPQTGGRWKYHLLHRFAAFNGDGHLPVSGLTPDGGGSTVYGTTLQGGSHGCGDRSGCGTVFQLTSGANGRWKETILYDFPDPTKNGAGPGGLVIGKAGELYGAASGGGDPACQCGVIFKMTPTRMANGPTPYCTALPARTALCPEPASFWTARAISMGRPWRAAPEATAWCSKSRLRGVAHAFTHKSGCPTLLAFFARGWDPLTSSRNNSRK